ncbi:MAG: von Willebrand factor type A domain-containing protein [Anaerolineaceae bacterium]|nr:von Willebrand factor type A domain-containing protein [Anaerolineaceae bacterium]
MNNRLFSAIALICILMLAACSPAAAPTAIAMEPQATAPRQREYAPEPTRAPYNPPTASPAATMAAPAPGNLPGENFHQDYGVNPTEDTWSDHLSTFALDVDTASYTLTKRYVSEGGLPPIDAVRAEEFINAFDSGYAAPEDVAFSLYADGAPNPFTESGTYLLRFGVQGYNVSKWERHPLNLTFVIDVSGSMSMENRLEMVKDSLRLLVDQLDERDTVAVVVYGSEARVVLEPTNGSDPEQITRVISRLRTEGSTNAEAGLRLGYRYAMGMYDPNANNRVILCSDGVANTGTTSVDGLLEFIGGYVEEGISLVTYGFGMGNYNDVLLEQLADRGDGSYAYIDDMDEARRLFVDELTASLQVIAYDAKVQVDFNSDVVSNYRLIGYENREVADQDFRDDSVDAGEIGAGMSAVALYEVELVPGAEGRMATVQLRWQDADTREAREINGNFNSWDLAASFEDADPYYRLAVVVGAFAEVLRASPYVQVGLNELSRHADRLARQIPDEQVSEFADLVQQSARLMRSEW